MPYGEFSVSSETKIGPFRVAEESLMTLGGVLEQEMNRGSLARPFHISNTLRKTISGRLRKDMNSKRHKAKRKRGTLSFTDC